MFAFQYTILCVCVCTSVHTFTFIKLSKIVTPFAILRGAFFMCTAPYLCRFIHSFIYNSLIRCVNAILKKPFLVLFLLNTQSHWWVSSANRQIKFEKKNRNTLWTHILSDYNFKALKHTSCRKVLSTQTILGFLNECWCWYTYTHTQIV